MKIETKRLTLRLPETEDAEELAKIGNDKEISYFTYFIPYPFTKKKAKRMIKEIEKERKEKKTAILFCILLKESSKIIGYLDLYDIDRKDKKALIGYWLGR